MRLSWLLRPTRLLAYFLLGLMLVIHFTPLLPWYARRLAGDWTDSHGDILIVLGSEIERDGVLGETSYRRCLYALRAHREHPYRNIVLCGGLPYEHVSVAGAMRDFLAANGVPREILHLEERSTSTRENALYTRDLIGGWPGTKILLTSDFHMFRARRAFEKTGLAVTPRPLPDVLKRSSHLVNRWSSFWGLSAETAKIAYYAARGWI